MIAKCIPNVIFKTRIRTTAIDGPNPFRWEDKTTADDFSRKKVVLFSLPGASRRPARPTGCPDLKFYFELFRSDGV
jgi:peroxiredoxin